MGLFDRIGQRLGDLVEDLATSDEVAELYKRARTAYEAGDFVEAALLAERVTQAEDEHVRAFTLLGLSQLRRDKLIDARSAFERALTLRPDDHGTLALLARTQFRLGDEAAAIASCKRALAGKVERELLDDLYGLLGEIFLRRGEAERAVRELRKAVAAAGGNDPRLVGLLGRALAAAGKDSLAAHHLAAAAAAAPDPAVLAALVRVLLQSGEVDEARLAALRLVEAEPRDVNGRCLLAEAQLASADPNGARETLLRALELDASQAEAHRLLSKAHAAVGDGLIAVEHLRVALGRADDAQRPELLADKLALLFEQLAPPTSSDAAADLEALLDELGEGGEELLRARPDASLALAAAAIGQREDSRAAMQLCARSLAAEETFEGRLALALLFAETEQHASEVTALRSALRLRPESPTARGRLRRAFARDLATPKGDREGLFPRFAQAERLLSAQEGNADLAAGAARLREDLDRPLLVAVMGEFNTGKSTFVNALIGEEVAPMGITPTTATINVLKYGPERGARVIWRDDTEELLPWEQVGAFLRGLDNERAREVRFVELMEPSEALLRVNVVDTPGLNSIVEEHEQTAREFLQQADAVVWLFAADQAGKETEELALEVLAQQRKKTVGVLNKVDRLRAQEVEQVVSHLGGSFSELVEAMLPVSAKGALEARMGTDEEALEASRFPALRAFLEERIFSRSRRIKREAAQRKLRELLGQGRDRVVSRLQERAALRSRLVELRDRLHVGWSAESRLAEERRQLKAAFEEVFRRGAEEVLDFVRPRRWRLGNHRAEEADRDFLLELLSDSLDELARASEGRTLAALATRGEELCRGLATVDEGGQRVIALERALAEQRTLLTQQVYRRFSAFARGFLLGGWIDDFFARRLPDLDLSPQMIHRQLAKDSPTFVAELLDPLRQWDQACEARLAAAMATLEREVILEELELEASARDPLTRLEGELAAPSDERLADSLTMG